MYNHRPADDTCPFCRLVGGEDTAAGTGQDDVVYRNEWVTAFLSLHWRPNNPGHVLVVPNAHHENLYDLPDRLGEPIQRAVRRVALAMKRTYGCSGVSTWQHNEPDGNQDVWRYHLHVFPRYEQDKLYQSSRWQRTGSRMRKSSGPRWSNRDAWHPSLEDSPRASPTCLEKDTNGMSLADFDALSFDCYGTLIDWETGLKAGLARIGAHAPEPVETDSLLDTYAVCEAETERVQPGLVYPRVIARSIIATGALWGIEVPPALAAAIGASVPDWPAFPDSAAALARLQQQYKLIILSNVDRASFAGSNQRLKVTFDAIVTAEDVGSYKPDPRNFEALLATAGEMGITPGRLLHVAQSLFHDHAPARAAGLPTVWIDRRHDQPGFGATPPPPAPVEPGWSFPSMAAFAAAVDDAF